MLLFDLLADFELGHKIGELIEPFITPHIDELHLGSGPAGEAYNHFITEHNFDPIHPLDSFHAHETDTTHHDQNDAASHHDDDNSFHHDDSSYGYND